MATRSVNAQTISKLSKAGYDNYRILVSLEGPAIVDLLVTLDDQLLRMRIQQDQRSRSQFIRLGDRIVRMQNLHNVVARELGFIEFSRSKDKELRRKWKVREFDLTYLEREDVS